MVDLGEMFDSNHLMLLDNQARARIRQNIRYDITWFKSVYRSVYNKTMETVVQNVTKYDSKVNELLGYYNFLRQYRVSVPLCTPRFPRTTYGTIFKLKIKGNSLFMEVISEQNKELLTFKEISERPRGHFNRVQLRFERVPYSPM